MSDFWKKIKGLFSSVEKSSASNPAVHELIERSEEELKNYEAWKNSLSQRRLIDWLNGEYITYLTSPCLLYTSPSPRDQRGSRMPSSA